MRKNSTLLLICFSVLLLNNTCKTTKKTTTVAIPDVVELTPPQPPKAENYAAPDLNYPPLNSYFPDSITSITINLVGDLMCHLPQTNNAKLANGDFDFNPSFEYIKPFLQNADVTIGNLETTFAGTSKPYAGYPAFNSPDAYCAAVKNAGFDFLVTSNNHSMDTQEDGLLRTIDVISQNGMGYTGTYKSQRDRDSIRILNVKGVKIAILNYTYGTNGSYPSNLHRYMLNIIDSATITKDIAISKQKGADAVLVFYHFGVENVAEPTFAQKSAVKFALDGGAHLVIGAHPHVVGPTEEVVYSQSNGDTAFVAYSLGNFLSNQYWRYTDAGVILKVSIEKNFTKHTTHYKNANYMPTWVYRGDGVKKMHVLFPAQWATDNVKLPEYITEIHRKKMLEAFEDTKQMMTKKNPKMTLLSAK